MGHGFVFAQPGIAVLSRQEAWAALSGPAPPARTPPLSETSDFLLLDVAGVTCALARTSMSEVLPLPELHAPPAGGGPLAGFLNLGGSPVPVVDLARLLGLGAQAVRPEIEAYRHILLDAPGTTGFLVDRVEDLITVETAALRPVAAERTLNGCVVGEIARDDGLIHVLGLAHLLTAEERARLSALADAAAERLAALPMA